MFLVLYFIEVDYESLKVHSLYIVLSLVQYYNSFEFLWLSTLGKIFSR